MSKDKFLRSLIALAKVSDAKYLKMLAQNFFFFIYFVSGFLEMIYVKRREMGNF